LDKSQLLKEVWNEYNGVGAGQKMIYNDEYRKRLFTNLFCPGPNISFITEFPSQSIEYVDECVERFLGIPEQEFCLHTLLTRVHPDDLDMVVAAEEKIFWFIDKVLEKDDLLLYKFSYTVRFRASDDVYHHFLHQAVVLQVDAFNRISRVLSINSQIDHISMRNTRKLSVIHMDGGPSYFNICPFTEGIKEGEDKKCSLSDRELDTLRLFAEGHNYKEVADILNVSPNTIRTHKQNILKKSNSKNMVQVITRGLRQGWI